MTLPAHKIMTLTPEKGALEGLSHVIERHLHDYFEAHTSMPPLSGLYTILLQEFERPLLTVTLKAAGGNQKKAADILGINRNTLKRKLDEYGIDPSNL